MDRLRRSQKHSTPLSSTALDVSITDLVAEYVIRHTFQNLGKAAIEAVFSFPVPLDAAFLGMKATLGGETLFAQIQAQRQASRTYDDAIAGGHSAVLLRNPEPGVLCTSLGNLLPGETGEIELRFVTSLGVADRTARFILPLVHRPRYGTWRLEDLEAPTHDFAVEHPMSASIHVDGLLASAPVSCATHGASFALREGRLEMTLSAAMLDRDLVLTFELSQNLPPTARLIHDGEGVLGLVSFVLPERNDAPGPIDLCLVLDGSGSMEGDAIKQSRQATRAIIDALGDTDRIQVLRFGSSVTPMFRRPLLATARVRDTLRELVPTIDSNMGGTEMGDALAKALEQLGDAEAGRSRAIILVTDGAVQPGDIADARLGALIAGVRIFVVAVGSSAGTEVLGPMAEATGAVLERAVPAEPIDVGVMRQFRRAREPGAVALEFEWPGAGATPIPAGVAYPGDAVDLAAALSGLLGGDVVVRAPTLDFALRLPLGSCISSPALRALLGQRRYRLAAKGEKAALALRYGLLTEETSAVVVKIRADGSLTDGLPTIVQVPQMTSAGMTLHQNVQAAASVSASYDSLSFEDSDCMVASPVEMPAFLRRSAASALPKQIGPNRLKQLKQLAQPTQTITISADRAREICLQLHHILFDSWLASRPKLGPLGEAINRLPADMRNEASCLLKQFGLSIHNQVASIQLLFALTTSLDLPGLTDDDEAMLAHAFAMSGSNSEQTLRSMDSEDSRLELAISTSMRQETSMIVTSSLQKLFETIGDQHG